MRSTNRRALPRPVGLAAMTRKSSRILRRNTWLIWPMIQRGTWPILLPVHGALIFLSKIGLTSHLKIHGSTTEPMAEAFSGEAGSLNTMLFLKGEPGQDWDSHRRF